MERLGGENIPEDLTTYVTIYFKYALITSVDVEKRFSQYKNQFKLIFYLLSVYWQTMNERINPNTFKSFIF